MANGLVSGEDDGKRRSPLADIVGEPAEGLPPPKSKSAAARPAPPSSRERLPSVPAAPVPKREAPRIDEATAERVTGRLAAIVGEPPAPTGAGRPEPAAERSAARLAALVGAPGPTPDLQRTPAAPAPRRADAAAGFDRISGRLPAAPAPKAASGVEPAESSREPRPFSDWLVRIAAEPPVPGLHPALQATLRPGAAAISAMPDGGTREGLRALTDPLAIRAAVEATHLEMTEVLAYWRPLLAFCREGTNTTPLRDLKRVQARAEMLASAAAALPESADRDAAKSRADGARFEVSRWIPAASADPMAPTAYTSLGGARAEDVVPAEAPPANVELSVREASQRRLLGLLLAVLAAAIVFTFGPGWLEQAKPELAAARYKEAIAEVTDKAIVDGILTVTVDATWEGKARDVAVEDVLRLQEAIRGERFSQLVVRSTDGRDLLRISDEGVISWVPGAKNPSGDVAD